MAVSLWTVAGAADSTTTCGLSEPKPDPKWKNKMTTAKAARMGTQRPDRAGSISIVRGGKKERERPAVDWESQTPSMTRWKA